MKNTVNHSHIIFGFLVNFYKTFQIHTELHSLNLKLYSEQYNKNFVFRLIVAPQLSSGWWHNYSTKTRQVDHADEQSMYSLISMIIPPCLPWPPWATWNKVEMILYVLNCPRLPRQVLFYVSMPVAFLQKYFTSVYTELSIDFCKFCVHVNLS